MASPNITRMLQRVIDITELLQTNVSCYRNVTKGHRILQNCYKLTPYVTEMLQSVIDVTVMLQPTIEYYKNVTKSH